MEEIIEIEEEEMSMSVASHSHNVISYNNDRLILPNIKEINLSYLPELDRMTVKLRRQHTLAEPSAGVSFGNASACVGT
ncbi:hypothetical protein CKAN_00138100 [Cinnamomum micranthum f. kanehirae]|uniref:Uncharacterized protein n=1 Tax=Cinnamomum micranthum f. kanehirae TaxID=337451 RepID=A0A443N3L9_9MAGN|nr:hypothetical protein CKAN_00138100 [Cinnamomum micranthum f. kanehirae]